MSLDLFVNGASQGQIASNAGWAVLAGDLAGSPGALGELIREGVTEKTAQLKSGTLPVLPSASAGTRRILSQMSKLIPDDATAVGVG